MIVLKRLHVGMSFFSNFESDNIAKQTLGSSLCDGRQPNPAGGLHNGDNSCQANESDEVSLSSMETSLQGAGEQEKSVIEVAVQGQEVFEAAVQGHDEIGASMQEQDEFGAALQGQDEIEAAMQEQDEVGAAVQDEIGASLQEQDEVGTAVQGKDEIGVAMQAQEGIQEISINDSLIDWYNRYNVPLIALRDLLHILKPYHASLPADPRTLLHTRSYEIEQNGLGHFVYFGLIENLQKNINFDLTGIDVLKLDVNIDGVPIFKSRNTSFWPILCTCSNSVEYSPNSILPFIVAIFYGEGKPEITNYLEKFCSELKYLHQDGITIGTKHLKVELRCIIADAPAKAYLKQIKTHGGYFACDRCYVKGVYKHKAMSYGDLKAELRNDETFRNKDQPEHHVGSSPFESLTIDMVHCFAIDYMHLINLGIVRKLLSLYLNKIPYKMSSAQKNEANERIQILKKIFPSDFNRKPRSLNDLDRFKASEFRTIIMYTGAVIFKNLLNENMYQNFLTLMFLVRILCDEQLIHDQEMLNYARELCILFVRQFKRIYKGLNVTYNIHSLIHIVDDVQRFGVLDSFSAFPFENCLGNIKRRIRSSNRPLAQISRRISEGYSFHKKNDITKEKGIIVKGHKIVPQDKKNSYVRLQNNKIASVEETIADDHFKVKIFQGSKSAFRFPCDSAFLNIFSVREASETSVILKNEIIQKCILIPCKKRFIAMPLL